MKKQITDREIIAALAEALDKMLKMELDFFNMKREDIKATDTVLHGAKKALKMADCWPEKAGK